MSASGGSAAGITPIKDRTAIVGIGQTELAKRIDRASEAQLAAEAVVAAVSDAGIAPSEVDGLALFDMETTDEVSLAKIVGLGDLTFFSQVGYGGGAGCGTVAHAAIAVATGLAEVVVAYRSRKRGSGRRPWTNTGSGTLAVPGQWTRPFGLLRPVDEIAMLTRRYCHEFGATREHLANVALAVRAHANRNPNAVMYEKPMSRDDYFAARMISEPLCLFDNCLETDGALAVVVVSAERAKDCPHPPAYIHAASQGLPRLHHTMVSYWADEPLGGPARTAAKALFRHADFGPQDLDVAQIYDAFTPLVLLSLEGYGIVGEGEAGPFTDDGNIELGGTLPVNTSGGGLSEAYVHGFNLITEGVKQMRGTSTSQVEGAETCLVTSGEGVPTSALLLRR